MAEIASRVKKVVADSFEVDASSLHDSTRARDVEGWDSLAHAILIIRLQRVFSIELDPAQANGAQDLGRLIALVEQTLARRR